MDNIAKKSNKDDSLFDDSEIFDETILAKLDTSFSRENNSNVNHLLNISTDKEKLNVSALCCNEEISGYDKLTGQNWIYPTNYPVRDYQFNIIQASILKNTLVSLPTGLGKTFIAAVIMYNYYRWYPLGKIVFTAPTRPLVAQQIDACYNIVALPQNDTIEMTGNMQSNKRKAYWQNKRVFFATPQVVYNDIKSGICPGEKIRCLVIDEAHRARGNYAYGQIVSLLTEMGHKTYRILALSATPGSKVEDVVNLVKNLHIAHLELRTENCIDVAPYSHTRKIHTEIVQLGPMLTQLRRQYVEILDDYSRRLKLYNVLPENTGNLSRGRIIMLYKEYQAKERGARHPQHNYIMKDFTFLISLYHGLELLVKHGSRVFLNFFDEHPEKSWIQEDDRLTALLERLRDDLGVDPLSLNTSVLPDGTIPEIPKDLCFGHPKFDKLRDIMTNHFKKAQEKGQDTRAIVFCEYRESVNLVHCLLLQCRPLIVPQMFVGQGTSGKKVVSQKQQLRVMRSFREGTCNTLVATCVAEEGLDVGSVDLILCFDISTRSPIRLVQRCGRTGRERSGQVYILVTEGREHQTLRDCMRQRDGLNYKILRSREVHGSLYDDNPRMIPQDFMPKCQKMYITVAQKPDDNQKKRVKGGAAKKGQRDLRNMLIGRSSASSSATTFNNEPKADLLSKEQFNDMLPEVFVENHLSAKPTESLTMSRDKIESLPHHESEDLTKLPTLSERQPTLQETVIINLSEDTESSVLQNSETKKIDMPPSTQNPISSTQIFATQNILPTSLLKTNKTKKKPKAMPVVKSPVKKDGDIRALFSIATKSTKSYTKLINDLGFQSNDHVPTNLVNLFVDLSLYTTNVNKKCYICQNVCKCSLIENFRKYRNEIPTLDFLNDLQLPNIDLIDDISKESIQKYIDENGVGETSCTLLENNENLCDQQSNFDLDFEFVSPVISTVPDNKVNTTRNKQLEEKPEKSFDVGEIEDLFAETSPEEVDETNEIKTKNINSVDPKEALDFFGLDSIEDIFADSYGSIEIKNTEKSPELDFKASAPDRKSTTNKFTATARDTTPQKISTQKSAVMCISDPEQPFVCGSTRNIIQNNNDKQTYNSDSLRPQSPSILSGRVKSEPTSPIICSQSQKSHLRIKKNLKSSTPLNNTKKNICQDYIDLTDNDNDVTDTTNKSMLTITQLVEMINKTGNDKSDMSLAKNSTNQKDNSERSTSPILLSQAYKIKNKLNGSQNEKASVSEFPKKMSLIILESSDSEGDDTESYSYSDSKLNKPILQSQSLSCSSKRKLEFDDDDVISASPFFRKKIKLDKSERKFATLQEKVLSSLTSNKSENDGENSVNFMVTSPRFQSLKENSDPVNGYKVNDKKANDRSNFRENIDALQIFKKTSLPNTPKHLTDVNGTSKVKNNTQLLQIFKENSNVENIQPKNERIINTQQNKREIHFDDSDDDFIAYDKYVTRSRSKNNVNKSLTNHKVRKKKRKPNQFIDLEAEESDDGDGSEGDELSDDSVGSIVDFICDENITTHEDIREIYLKSIKSPTKGVFKIPLLSDKHKKMDVLSQYEEEDTYEMDSFCVDSHIGLTQANEISELELAEMVLEKQKSSKNRKSLDKIDETQGSPVVRRRKKVRRRIESDSDESS